jgi:hypothetical protein
VFKYDLRRFDLGDLGVCGRFWNSIGRSQVYCSVKKKNGSRHGTRCELTVNKMMDS